ncbi:sulfite oxidase heme-binding subunit YedZ [Aliikangiella sp. G2MR2-5]|uniref:sulfite oxidase heme-binding subunit YedZ n=1 Tax=Aliikangiella sp. G2MR2-5 TaxID=2788943 RepID=UPI0018AC43A4|nr:protein-methionine-sulfoxide reductase heme-binding subunit MsrQ [Aliikangiella sp. G2MR2-5]
MNKQLGLKIFVHCTSWLPLVWLVYAALNQLLGGDPQTKLMHELGLWGLIFLLASLSMTPLKNVSGYSGWIRYRRLLGLYSYFYLILHVLTYFWLYLDFSVHDLADEIVKRPYIMIGAVGILLMTPLAITSTRYAQKRLGKSWKKLHKMVYFIAFAGLVHQIWQSKSDINEPMIYICWWVVLMLLRVEKVVGLVKMESSRSKQSA